MYQIKSEKPKDHGMLNGAEISDVEVAGETSSARPVIESSKSSDAACATISDVTSTGTSTTVTSDVTKAMTSDNATIVISDTVLLPTTVSTSLLPAATSNSTASISTTLLPTTTTSTTTTVLLPTSSSSTVLSTTVPTVSTSTVPMTTSDSTLTTEVTTNSVSDIQLISVPSEESSVVSTKEVDIKSTEPKIGQKRPATDISGASAPKRTREVLRNSLQQLLEGKGSVSEDETTKVPSQPTNITGLNYLNYLLFIANEFNYQLLLWFLDVQLDNINVSDEVFQRLEVGCTFIGLCKYLCSNYMQSAMSMISSRELHSIIKPLQTSSSSSPTKSQPPITTSGDLAVKLEDDKLTGSAVTVVSTTLSEDKTSTVQANTQPQFNVPTVVYDKPCKRPKSILKGGNKIEQLDDVTVLSEESPTASTKVPRKIGLAEYKKRHKERRDSEDVVEDISNNNSAMEVVAEGTSKDCKKSVDISSSSSSPTDHLMIVEEAIQSSIDGTATSKANSDVPVSFKEEKKGESPSKSESPSVILGKAQSISKPIKIPHPMSVLAPSSSTIIPHKYTELTLPQYYPNAPYRHDWPTNYPVFGGLSRPYLMPHPPAAPLPSTILTTPLIPSVPPPPMVFDPLPSVSTQKADEEMARVEDLTEMFTKNLQSKLKRVIHSDDSSRESSPQPRKSRSLSRSLSPPPRSSRRGRSPRRSRKSNSRSQSLDSCRGSDHEQIRSRSKSPRSHKSHRSRRHRSSSRESSVEDRKHSRSSKRSRNDKRRDHKATVNTKTISTQTEENTYKSGDTKRLSEKEIQTDRLLFVHSKGSQTYPMFENHKAVQVDFSGVYSSYYNDFAQYLETYPLDMFHFNDILSTSVSYFEQEISKAFPCNKTLSAKQVKRILEFDHMKQLNSKLKTLLKESQGANPYVLDTSRPGTPLLDDNQPVINLVSAASEGGDGNEQAEQPYEESSGLSNSEILSDSEESDDSAPNIEELLSQYNNSSKATQEHVPPAEVNHGTPTKSHPEEPALKRSNAELSCKQSIKPDDKTCSIKGVHKENDDVESKITIKEESTDLDKSFVPENYILVGSPHQMSPPLPNTHFTTYDHTYSKNGSHPSGTHLKVTLDPSVTKTDRTFLTTIERKRTTKSSATGQKKSSPEVPVPLGEELYQSVKKGCEEFLSLSVCPAGDHDHLSSEDGDKLSIESDHDAVDMEISLTDSQNEEDSLGDGSAEEKVDESKSQLSTSSQPSTEDKNKSISVADSKAKGGARKAVGSTKVLHQYTYHGAGPLHHYQGQPFKYRQQQRPAVTAYYVTPPYQWGDWRRGGYPWGPQRY